MIPASPTADASDLPDIDVPQRRDSVPQRLPERRDSVPQRLPERRDSVPQRMSQHPSLAAQRPSASALPAILPRVDANDPSESDSLAASGLRPPAAAAPPAAAHAKGRARLVLAVKILVTVSALGYTFARMSVADLFGAVGRLSVTAVIFATALTLGNLVVAAFRWRVLLTAYGARNIPKLAFLSRAQLVGFFYNTFVPGNVTGDVLRGHATRDSFEGPLGSYMVVALERFFGLAGLFTLGAVGLLLHPLPGVMRADLLAALAFAMALAIAMIPVVGRKVGRFLPGRVGRWATNLPAVERPALLVFVLALSLVTHTIVGLTGHVLLDAIAPQITAAESLVLVPLAMISMYMPLSVAGLGVREAAFVFVFGKIAVSRADATAGSLAFFAVCAIVAAMGGLVHLLRPLDLGLSKKTTARDST